MQSVNDIAQAIVLREGGYVNDPDDPGGATKHGVTIGTMRALGLDLTGDGRVTTADVKTPDRRSGTRYLRKTLFQPSSDRGTSRAAPRECL